MSAPIRAIISDLDGVVWRGEEPIPEAVEALPALVVDEPFGPAATSSEGPRDGAGTIGHGFGRVGDIFGETLRIPGW